MNLLPNTEKEILKKALRTRFLIVANILLALAFLAGGMMLLPTRFLVRGHLDLIASLNSATKIEDEASVKKVLELPKEIDAKLNFFQITIVSKTAVNSLSKIISYLPDKVRLNSISFIRSQSDKEKKTISVIISGVAADRDSLVSFGNALKESKLFTSVDVPVSSLTKNKDLPFSINILIAD